MKIRILGLMIIGALSMKVCFGESTICKSASDERKIELKHLEEGKSLPVELIYTKNGNEKKICESKNNEGVCDPKAKDLIAKLESAGFKCEQSDKKVVLNK